MFFKVFAAFVVLPVLEIYILLKMGGYMGAAWTIFLVIATAFLGAWLAKLEGARTMYQLRLNLQQGIPPTDDILNAFLIFAAGLVFLTPGFITDFMGLLVLIPASRKVIKAWLERKIDQWMRQGDVYIIR